MKGTLGLKASRWRVALRVVLSILSLVLCGFLILDSARTGLSRFFSMLAIIGSAVEPADRAVVIAPEDPEAHYTRGLELVNAGRLTEALVELREATVLRPYHYYEWLDLGVTLDRSGDRVGAEDALERSISLAPSFAQPHWQLGNLLFRSGEYDEAFQELRRAARSDPHLTEGLLQLAWSAASEDTQRFLQFVRPENQRNHLLLAQFLATQGKGADAANEVRLVGAVTSDEERDVLRLTVNQLISTREFSDALDVWKLMHPESGPGDGSGRIVNGDFLHPIRRDDSGFGWQPGATPHLSVAIDTAGPTEQARSLLLEFDGEVNPSIQLLNQLVLVSPQSRYELRFAAKADQLVSGGAPIMVANNISSDPVKILGQSSPLPMGSTGWTNYEFEFSALDSTAVLFSLVRQQCSLSPCPIFGKLWLSKFELKKI